MQVMDLIKVQRSHHKEQWYYEFPINDFFGNAMVIYRYYSFDKIIITEYKK